MKRTIRKRSGTDRPTLTELDQTKESVLNSLASLQSRLSYQHAMDEFIEWYYSEPRLALNRGIVLRYRLQLEAKKLAAATINVRLAAFVAWPTKQPTRACLARSWSLASAG